MQQVVVAAGLGKRVWREGAREWGAVKCGMARQCLEPPRILPIASHPAHTGCHTDSRGKCPIRMKSNFFIWNALFGQKPGLALPALENEKLYRPITPNLLSRKCKILMLSGLYVKCLKLPSPMQQAVL